MRFSVADLPPFSAAMFSALPSRALYIRLFEICTIARERAASPAPRRPFVKRTALWATIAVKEEDLDGFSVARRLGDWDAINARLLDLAWEGVRAHYKLQREELLVIVRIVKGLNESLLVRNESGTIVQEISDKAEVNKITRLTGGALKAYARARYNKMTGKITIQKIVKNQGW